MGLRHLLPMLGVATAFVLPVRAEEADFQPAVARPTLGREAEALRPSTVFFLASKAEPGAIAVGTAHAFDLARLSRVQELQLRLARSERLVATTTRFYVPPGRSFQAAGGSLATDFVVFALDAAPLHVRILASSPEPPRVGARVRLLGVPVAIPQDEDDVFGFVTRAETDRLEVDLDVPVDLRGWGGAPVLDHGSGEVLGLVQAAVPGDSKLGIVATPIGVVLEAMARPLEGGRGRPFAAFPGGEPLDTARAATTEAEPSPAGATASDPTAVRRWWERTGTATPEERKTLLDANPDETRVLLEVEHPYEGAIFGAEAGAFVAGRALALRGELKRFDVILVIDTSGSTKEMSGADINSNGIVGEQRVGGLFGATDSGDSILAAEVAAARQLLTGLDSRSTRVGLVSFSGQPPTSGGFFAGRNPPPAFTEEPLTREYSRVERALDAVLDRGPDGLTHMKAGIEQAVIELVGARGALSEPDPESEKVILFLTDGQPTLPYDPMMKADNTRAVFRAAEQARRAGVRIHSFAIGPDALDGPAAAVEMAKRTNGYFTPVRHPGDLVDLIEEVNFANLESIRVRNLTTGDETPLVEKKPDGAWSALVPLAVGKNRIEVTARATDGAEARREVEVAYAPGAADPALAAELLPRRTALLEQRLIELRRERKEVELEAVELTRKELLLEMEKERSAAEERAEQQRKELELEVERDTRPPAEPD